jgi:hypothetical protein
MSFFITVLGLSLLVALYGAIATRRQLREDWPARKIRVRTGGRSRGGPFRDRDDVQEKVVPAGAPWLVRIASLFGHGLAPVSFFASLSAWAGVASLMPGSELDPGYATALIRRDSDIAKALALVVLVGAFLVGLRQWQCATLMLTTRYGPSRAAARWALAGRVLLDVPPLAIALSPSLFKPMSDTLPLVLLVVALTAHAGFAWFAVYRSKRDYLAVEEVRLRRLGRIP